MPGKLSSPTCNLWGARMTFQGGRLLQYHIEAIVNHKSWENIVKTLHFRQRSGVDGQLCLDIPVGKPDTECDVVVVVEPTIAPSEWLPGFWEQLSRGWQGEPLTRPPQGETDSRAPLQ